MEWNRGCVLASAQNFARELKEMPSNLLTPSLFVEAVGERLGGVARDQLEFVPRFAFITADCDYSDVLYLETLLKMLLLQRTVTVYDECYI